MEAQRIDLSPAGCLQVYSEPRIYGRFPHLTCIRRPSRASFTQEITGFDSGRGYRNKCLHNVMFWRLEPT